MPYKRKKPFLQKHQATLVNLLTVFIFAALVLTAVMLTPRAVERTQTDVVSGYGIDEAGK